MLGVSAINVVTFVPRAEGYKKHQGAEGAEGGSLPTFQGSLFVPVLAAEEPVPTGPKGRPPVFPLS